MLYSLPPTTTSKVQQTTETLSFRTTKNQAGWKSYNYRIKEEMTARLLGGHRHGTNWSHIHVCHIKIRRVMIKEQEVLAPPHALQPRVSVSGREVPINSGCKKKKQGLRLRKMKTSGFPVSSSSRIHAWTHSDSLSLTSRARSAACKASETHGEELNCLASG